MCAQPVVLAVLLLLISASGDQTPRVAHGGECESAQLRRLALNLPQLDDRKRLMVLAKLRDLGPEAVFAIEPLIQIWRQADGRTDDDLLAGVLDVFRAMGEAAAPVADSLCGFLPHECKINWNRDQLEVIRLRSYLMVTLGELGLPREAYPHVLDSLAHIDERVVAVEVGSAARALRSAGRRARGFIPYLLKVVPKRFAEEEFSLARYEVDFPDSEATTAQLEALRALSVLCHPEDEEAVGLLQRLAAVPDRSRWDYRAKDEAKRALEAIKKRKTSQS